mgnify:FL=1|tara:strand:+ start:285 stop:1328 length:1044 start_codon:yes stop_codon:yes gene_type:complete
MKMKKILTEWRKFVITESIEKSNFEKTIEEAWAQSGQSYNEELTYVKAALHAALYLNGGGTTNDEQYLNRPEFGKTATQRIQELNRNGAMFAEHFHVDEVYTPAEDKRFLDTKENKLKGIGVTPKWGKDNMNPSRITGVLSKGASLEEAYSKFFIRFEQLDQMLDSGNYDFLSAFGAEMGKTNPNIRHSGGAASTGMLIIPSEATDAETDSMMEDYLFYIKNSKDPNIDIAIEAERRLQSAIKAALDLWKKYGGFKDSDDEQVNKGAYLRMKQALYRSEASLKKLMRSPELYSPLSAEEQPLSSDERDEYEIAMTTTDKSEADRIMKSLQKAGDKRWRDIRVRMRSM